MKLHVVGCSHHNSPIELRERLAFSPEQTRDALDQLRARFPGSEAVLLSTCNRTELYTAGDRESDCPSHHDVVEFIADFHGLDAMEIFDDLFERTGEDTVRHLFTVAASLDSMVVGEAQILSQVKQAYELSRAGQHTGTMMHAVFQQARRVAKRVASETAIHQKRVSLPSVAVADFAKQIFERFDDKRVLVIGAGEMGEETLAYLIDEGARDITVVNRNFERAAALAARTAGRAERWERLDELLVEADLIVSTTGASQPIVTLQRYKKIEHERFQRTLFILDLAVPRDFDPAVGQRLGIYLYSLDDLASVCNRNRRARQREWPRAERIIDEEAARFMAELNHRSTGATIRRLKQQAESIKSDELARMLNKLGSLDERTKKEIERFADRLINKLLHPPLESLRDESHSGASQGLLDALKRLFQLKD